MSTSNTARSREKWKNMDLLIPYAAPYFAYVALSSVLQNKLPEEIIYIMKLVIVPGLLIWAWKWYVPLTGPKNKWISCLWGIVFGIIGLVVWCALYAPFTNPEDGAPWSDIGFGLRLLTAGFVVPVFEELFMRGFVFRVALQWDMLRKQKTPKAFSSALDEASIFDVAPAVDRSRHCNFNCYFCCGPSGWRMARSHCLRLPHGLFVDIEKRSDFLHRCPRGNQYRIGPLCLLLRVLGIVVGSGCNQQK